MKKYGYNRALDSSFEDYSKNIIGSRGKDGTELFMRQNHAPNPTYLSSDIPYDEVGFTMGESRINVPLQPDSYQSIIDSIEEMVEPLKFMPY